MGTLVNAGNFWIVIVSLLRYTEQTNKTIDEENIMSSLVYALCVLVRLCVRRSVNNAEVVSFVRSQLGHRT